MTTAWLLTPEEIDTVATAVKSGKRADLRAVRTCDPCGTSDWHPEAALCREPDCPITRAAR